MKEIMAISDIVLSLAREPEAFGRTALEALSLGTPVVAYNYGGAEEVMREIFPDGSVSPGKIDEAVERICKFIQIKPSITNKNPFTLKRMLNNTINLYEDLAELKK
jgi:glycosyltransferase involved in cell wall biosynthesis